MENGTSNFDTINEPTLRHREDILITCIESGGYVTGIPLRLSRKSLQQIHRLIENNAVNGAFNDGEKFAVIKLNGLNFRAKVIAQTSTNRRLIELIDTGVKTIVYDNELFPMHNDLHKIPRCSVKVRLKEGNVCVGEVRTFLDLTILDSQYVGRVDSRIGKLSQGGVSILSDESKNLRILPPLELSGNKRIKVISIAKPALGVILENQIASCEEFEASLQKLKVTTGLKSVQVGDYVLAVRSDGRKFRALVRAVKPDERINVEYVDHATGDTLSLANLAELDASVRQVAPFTFFLYLSQDTKSMELGRIYDVYVANKSDEIGRLFVAKLRRTSCCIPGARLKSTERGIVYSHTKMSPHQVIKLYGVQSESAYDIVGLLEHQIATDYAKNLKRQENVQIGDFVLAAYETNSFCRALVTNVAKDHVSVIHVDYGSQASVMLDKVYKIDPRLSTIPQCSFQCCIVNDGSLDIYEYCSLEILGEPAIIEGIPVYQAKKIQPKPVVCQSINSTREQVDSPSKVQQDSFGKTNNGAVTPTANGMNGVSGTRKAIKLVRSFAGKFAKNPILAGLHSSVSEAFQNVVIVAVCKKQNSTTVTLQIPALMEDGDKLLASNNLDNLEAVYASSLKLAPPALILHESRLKRARIVGRPKPHMFRLLLVDYGVEIVEKVNSTFHCPADVRGLPAASVSLPLHSNLLKKSLEVGQLVTVKVGQRCIELRDEHDRLLYASDGVN